MSVVFVLLGVRKSVQYNGGFLPDMILLTQCYYHRRTRLNAMKSFFLSLQPMIPSKRFDIFLPFAGRYSEESLDAFRFFFIKRVEFLRSGQCVGKYIPQLSELERDTSSKSATVV